LSEEFFAQIIAGALLAGIPLLFCALGETISERAGVLNIGLEGMMIMGAFAGFLGVYYGGYSWVGFATGAAAGAVVSLVMAGLCVRMGLDQIVVGIAITLSCEGITSLIHGAQFAETRPILGATENVAIPLLSRIPAVGQSLFSQPLVVYLGLGLVAFAHWMFRATNVGLNLRAAGDKPAALDAAGVSVVATRSWAVVSTGALAGLGGAYLAIVSAGIFEPFMTQGRGFIAIVIAMLGRGRPYWVLAGALLFGTSLSISDALQIEGINLSTDVVFMLPFIAVMAVLIVFARRAYLPAALGLPYIRGAR
jgi:simple sugar transport system permease protein